MKTMSLSEAKMKLSSLIDQVEDTDEEVVITRNGRPAAVLVSSDEYESWRETGLVAADAELMEEIRRGTIGLKARRAKLYTLDELLGD